MTFPLKNRLSERQRLGNFRTLEVRPSLIDFSSNDYLGLARSSQLAKAVAQERKAYLSHLNGLGSTGSRLLTGNTEYAQELETWIARLHGYEAGLLFNCGYMANVGLLSAISQSEDLIFFDQHIHASMGDGMRLGQAHRLPFRHNDVAHLKRRLRASKGTGNRFICVESIYSTDGSVAPLLEICQLAKEHNAHVIVDEAHAIGIHGLFGYGLVEKEKLSSQIFAQINTFGKALGTYGAIVLGSNDLIQTLVNFAKSCIYSTALPFHCLAAIKSSYDLFPHLEKERKHLQKLIELFQIAPHASSTPIQFLRIKGNASSKEASKRLMACGFDVRPLLSPTVRKGQEGLRVCLHAFNTELEVKNVLQEIAIFL